MLCAVDITLVAARQHEAMEVSLSKGAMWAAIAVFVAILLMVVGQWLLALATAFIGGLGYVVAKSIEDV
ncbi:MAG: hypothetical protein ACRD3W_30785, partial [Terriglobales bacterium]